ncbi:MAG: hypothetical protein FWC91_14780, partial [Defluviitaleaceae bacterium]|nr:hypothetical protein [Defluviitaleaceae bacterium]
DFYDDLTSYDDLYQEDDLIIFLDDLLDEDIIAESERMIIEQFGQTAWTNYASAFPASQRLRNMFPRDRLGNTMYPYDFGGMYFRDGMLVVQVVENSSTINNDDHFTRILPEYVIIEKVRFSQNYLHEVQAIFSAFINANYDIPLTQYIYGWGQRASNNQMTVLIQYNEESLSSFAYIIEYLGLNPEYFNLEFIFGDPAPCNGIFAPPED